MFWFWIILAIILGIGELFTVEFLLLWFALGAVAAGATAKVLPFLYQLSVFVLVSFVCTILSRKLIHHKEVRTNVSALIGKEAIVTETVQKSYCDRGLVRVEGEIWRAYTDEDDIPAGKMVIIQDVVGVKLKVTAKRKP